MRSPAIVAAMSDAEWREAIASWRASGDPDALERALRLARRAGRPVGALLDARVRPGRELRLSGVASGVAVLPEGTGEPRAARGRARGRGPGACERDRTHRRLLWLRALEVGRGPAPIQLPPYELAWVEPQGRHGPDLATLLEDARRERAPGLNLGGGLASDAALAGLEALDSLETLLLHACPQVTGRALLALPPELRCLGLAATSRVSDDELRALERYPALTHLDLHDGRGKATRGAGAIAAAARLPQLTHLDVTGLRQVGPDDVTPLAGLSELHTLALGGGYALGLPALEVLAALPRLRRLRFVCPRDASDRELASLTRLRGLTDLALAVHPDGDVGEDPAAFAVLSELPALRRLDLWGRWWPLGQREAIEAVLPGVDVQLG